AGHHRIALTGKASAPFAAAARATNGSLMRILLAQNSRYYPAHGGGDKSNRLLVEALAARGHTVRAVARISVFGEAEHERYLEALRTRGQGIRSTDGLVVRFERHGVDWRVAT